MAYTVSLLAIKDSPSDQILDFVADYYKNHKLILVEEHIGNRVGKYTNSKKWYKNLEEYQEDAYPEEKSYFTTNFDFYDNLDENKNWKIFVYYIDSVLSSFDFVHTVNINYELAQFLADKLQTTTLLYEYMNTVDNYLIRKYIKGALVDHLSTSEGEMFACTGYFEGLKPEGDIFMSVEKYFNENLFYPEAADLDNLYNEKRRRPMYLKGHPDDIINFFQHQEKFSRL